MKTQIIPILLAILLGVSCTKTDAPGDFNNLSLSEKSLQLVEADNQFGLEAFSELLKSDNLPDNVMISPLSISLALAMTYNGSETATKEAFEEVFNWANMSRLEVNQSYKALIDALLDADPKVTNEIANSIWIRNGYPILESFKNINIDYYYAQVENRDFGNPETLDEINGWISDKTHNKINNMIDQIDPSHIMFLINAIYFKGTWRTEFAPENTQKRPFYFTSSNSVSVDMMNKTDTLNYMSNELFSSVEIPYGSGNYTMMIFLPNQNKSCNDIANAMDADNWKNWMDSYTKKNSVYLTIPKFKSEYKIKLNQILTNMGLGVAFTGAADFTSMNGTGGLFIDYVQHNTFIEVNEEGTEAAAATVVAIKETSSIGGEETIFFNVNRPFLYAITEKSTGSIMFIGKIGDPSE